MNWMAHHGAIAYGKFLDKLHERLLLLQTVTRCVVHWLTGSKCYQLSLCTQNLKKTVYKCMRSISYTCCCQGDLPTFVNLSFLCVSQPWQSPPPTQPLDWRWNLWPNVNVWLRFDSPFRTMAQPDRKLNSRLKSAEMKQKKGLHFEENFSP